MALAENLAAAEDAVRQVKTLGIRASNRRADRLARVGGVDRMIEQNMVMGQENQGPMVGDVLNVRNRTTAPSTYIDSSTGGVAGNTLGPFENITLIDVLNNIRTIVLARNGNCLEQAELALYWIYANHPTARPLDLMYFRNNSYDHVWVGIGLAPGWNTVSPIRIGARTMGRYDVRNWGSDAVWCDPWQSGGVAFSVADLVAGKVRNLDAIYKCNTSELIAEGWPGSYLRVN